MDYFLVGLLLLWQIEAKASYSIENMDIKATVLESGDVHIKQSITYQNGVVYTKKASFGDMVL